MNAIRNSKLVARSIVTTTLAIASVFAGLMAAPASAAGSCTSGYVIVDDQGNTVVPEWASCDDAETGAVPGGYAIVGEDGAVYVPEQIGDGAIEVAADTGVFVIVGEGGVAISPEGIGDGSFAAVAPSIEASGYAIVGDNGTAYVPEQASAAA